MQDIWRNATWACLPYKDVTSRGVFLGDNPFDFAVPVLYTQLSVAALVAASLQFILTPLGESAFISQMLTGIVLGPSILGKDEVLADTIYPGRSMYTIRTIGAFASMLFMFIVGVKMDLSMVTKSGKKALVIGLCAFFLPLMLSTTLAYTLKRKVNLEPNLYESLIQIAVFQSSSSFHVIACLLADLNLLNSELGRLATSSSMVSGLCSWIWFLVSFMVRQNIIITKKNTFPLAALSVAGMLLIIICIMRPILLWMIRQTTKRKQLKESYMFSIFLMILTCSLLGDIVGIHFVLGPMILGLTVPDGWPLGSAIVDKLESYVSLILLPTYYVLTCGNLDIFSLNLKTTGIVELLALSSFLGKVIGTMLPSLYCKMPIMDSLCLGLIMSTQGITDVINLQIGILLFVIDNESYNAIAVTFILMTGITAPIVKILYNPSKRYMSFRRRRTIQHTMPNEELRLLACIYHQNSTPSLINLLEVSNPMTKSPICFYAVHLMELQGRSAPILVAHQQGKRSSIHSNHSEHIINAFWRYEQHNLGKVTVHPFTAIAPYATMHDEICNLALEKRVSMVIIPFHKHWTLHGSEECDKHIKAVNFKILKNVPCSVGILVDKETLSGRNSGGSKPLYSIGMIFLEGPDDREALAYAMRMAEHPNVSLTVIRLVQPNKKSTELDCDMIKRFRRSNIQQKHHIYKERVVKDCVEMINVIKLLENHYELILVGRQHESNSPLFMGLTLWNEYPELGYLGDMLVSSESDWEVSVLVVQQQTFEGEDMPEGFKLLMEDAFSVNGSISSDTKLCPNSHKTI
ncbi:cation/H(+) antiporter 15-like [Quercus robur]|uniref:cation/H(+) antiporter 15-like n=1 Tax=Quercus robur TaxID=38942 RepID=UPI002163D3E0|nr:cation/H(+) antiporter 15-like [Quercus robur]